MTRRDPWPPREDLPEWRIQWDIVAVWFGIGAVTAGFWLLVFALVRWLL